MLPFTPILLARKPVPRVWGGTKLQTVLGIELPAEQPISETWLLFDRPDGSSALAGSSETVRDLMRRDPVALLGKGVGAGYGGSFPIMLKFLDAGERLSLQVHPDDDQARGERDGGKHEVGVVLQAGPDARLMRGLRAGVTREQFLAAIDASTVEALVTSITPRAGDCIDVPPGTVHSFGPDVLMFEVEQNSDVTYRLYDWGRPRDVQLDKALGVARQDGDGERAVVEPRPLPGGGQLLIENEWLRLRRYDFDSRRILATGGRFLTITVASGLGAVVWQADGTEASLNVGPGDTVLVPACVAEVAVSPRSQPSPGRLDALICDPGTRR